MRHPRILSGFTVVELMITVAVLAVMTALAVPAFTEFFEKSRLRGAADDVVSFFNAQRLAAVKFDRDVHVSVRGVGPDWCVGARMAAAPAAPGQQVPAVGTCDCFNDPSTCTVDSQPAVLASTRFGVATTRPTIDSADILITYDGRRGTLDDFADAGDVLLTSSSGRWALRVDVLVLGHARTCWPSDKLPMNGYNRC